MSFYGLVTFCVVYFVAVATPGPGVAAVIAQGLARGSVGAPAFIAGFLVGDLIWFSGAALGLSALAQTNTQEDFLRTTSDPGIRGGKLVIAQRSEPRTFNPAVAVAAGVLLLSEPFTVTIAAAFVLILTGCALATGGRSPDRSGDGSSGNRGQPDQDRHATAPSAAGNPDQAPAGQP